MFVAVHGNRSFFEWWDIESVPNRAAIAAAVGGERVIWEWHFGLKVHRGDERSTYIIFRDFSKHISRSPLWHDLPDSAVQRKHMRPFLALVAQ